MPVMLITGGAIRIGRLISLYFAKKNWSIIVHYHKSQKQAVRLLEGLKKFKGNPSIERADFEDESSYQDLIQRIYRKYGRLDVLIHNASIFENDSIQTCSKQSWSRHMDINLRAPIALTQAMASLRQEFEQNSIMILDQRVWNLTHHFFSYTLSKAALWTATRTLALSLAPHIRVNAIGPGPIFARQNRFDEFDCQVQKTLLKRPANPRDLLKTIDFLLNTPSITGQMIALDSGQHLM